MEYNFSRISCDAICNAEKKLAKVFTNVMDDISNFIHVLNQPEISEKTGEMNQDIGDIVRDYMGKNTIQLTAVMNQINKVLEKYL